MGNLIQAKEKARQPAQPDATKRNLIKGAAAAGLVLTVSSRSAWGTNCSISGMMSGNMSRTEESYECRVRNGKSPGFWKKHPACWPASINMGTITVKLKRKKAKNEYDEYDEYEYKTVDIAYPGSTSIDSNYLRVKGQFKKHVKIDSGKKWEVKKLNYTNGDTLGSLLGLVGYSKHPMYYLKNGNDFTKHVTAALLSSLHPIITRYGSYAPEEIIDAVHWAITEYKEDALVDVLKALQDEYGSAEASNLIITGRYS